MSHRPFLLALVVVVVVVAALVATLGVSPDGIPRAAAATSSQAPVTIAALFMAGLKGGLLTFGGAYTAIPYVRADTVGRGWIGDATFLDGVALAGVIPAPLVIFATFIGYVVDGPVGALAITAGMFLPAFAFSLIFFERLEAIVEDPALHRVLTGVAAAVVGVVAFTIVELGVATGMRVTNPLIAFALFQVVLVVVWVVKRAWVTPAVIAGSLGVGWFVTV